MMTCLQLFRIFLNIGAFTLGGGYAMLSMVKQAIVEQKKWISEKEFWEMITIVQSLPGVFAINTALYVGYKIKGKTGALAAMLGAGIPSFFIILLIATFFVEFKDNEIVERIFKGIRPCVVALILAPAIQMIKSANLTWKTISIPIIAALLIWLCHVSPIYIIIAAALGGQILRRI
ncbi:MAG: chromate transporter [Paludibacteraceae bacterium]|nr:chromate transporter [Paludibacteraceae bacterium]MBR4839517.1 chromate transporter [Paludibacteraceae bacterium]